MRGAGTGGHLRGVGTGGHFAVAGGIIVAAGGGTIFAVDGGDSDFAAGGGWLGRWGNDFSADLTDVNDGSSTFALRSALLEAHFRARGYTYIVTDGGTIIVASGDGTIIAADGTPTRDRRLSRHLKIVSCQVRLEVSGSSKG